MQLRQLTEDEAHWLDSRLEEHDSMHLPKGSEGAVQIGVEEAGRLIAGADG